jgi:hypothetical protein
MHLSGAVSDTRKVPMMRLTTRTQLRMCEWCEARLVEPRRSSRRTAPAGIVRAPYAACPFTQSAAAPTLPGWQAAPIPSLQQRSALIFDGGFGTKEPLKPLHSTLCEAAGAIIRLDRRWTRGDSDPWLPERHSRPRAGPWGGSLYQRTRKRRHLARQLQYQ